MTRGLAARRTERLVEPLQAPDPLALAEALDEELAPASLASRLDLPIDAVPPRLWEQALGGPARAFLARPGKRFRGRLVEVAWRLAGAGRALPPELPLLVEILHAGSLIVDDIEDGAEERRGAPALHRVVGVPLALNTGNWMYYWASSLLAGLGLPAELELGLGRDVQRALLHCHHGQALDLSARIGELSRGEVRGVVAASTRLKTGSLLELAARLGARAAGAPVGTVELLGAFGRDLGLGLQMLDDLSSVASPARRDKAFEDLRHGRPTWPWAWTADRVGDAAYRALLAAQHELAAADEIAAWSMLPRLTDELSRACAAHGRSHAHEHLHGALGGLRAWLGDGAALGALADEVERLEASYA